jgi:hypothetical protein
MRVALLGLTKKELGKIVTFLCTSRRKDNIVEILLGNETLNFDLKDLSSLSDNLQKNILGEPACENKNKKLIRKWFEKKGFKTKKEIDISGSCADIVALKKSSLFSASELVAITIKNTNKVHLDKSIKQINDFLEGVDKAYLAVTPLSLLKNSKKVNKIKKAGAGLIVYNKNKILSNFIEPKKNEHIDYETYNEIKSYFKK